MSRWSNGRRRGAGRAVAGPTLALLLGVALLAFASIRCGGHLDFGVGAGPDGSSPVGTPSGTGDDADAPDDGGQRDGGRNGNGSGNGNGNGNGNDNGDHQDHHDSSAD